MFREFIYSLKISSYGMYRVFGDRRKLLRSSGTSLRPHFPIKKRVPVFTDFTSTAGTASGHYFHQDLYMARKIFEIMPKEHYDLGSRVDGFVAHLAVFLPVQVFDIRNLKTSAKNIHFRQLDIMDFEAVSQIPKVHSLSCLHTIEHFGLGRYGDRIDYDGWYIGLKNLASLLEVGGLFYLSTPISYDQRIEFNAHRVFNPLYLSKILLEDFDIIEMAMVGDDGELRVQVDFTNADNGSVISDRYGCGLWVLRKK